MMGTKITKTQDPARENVGLTIDDLASFIAETERAGIPADTVLTDCRTVGMKFRLKRVSVEYDG